MSAFDRSHQAEKNRPMFTPNTYKFVVPFECTGGETLIGKKRIRLFTARKPESPNIVEAHRANSDEPIDIQSWSFTGTEEVLGGTPSYAVSLFFDAPEFQGRLRNMDREHRELVIRLKEFHAASDAECGGRSSTQEKHVSGKRTAPQQTAEELEHRIAELEQQRAPLTNLLRAFVLGTKLHFKLTLDGVMTSLFLDVNHKVVAPPESR